jgi:hypothetical protein
MSHAMKRPAILFAVAGILFILHVVARLAGLAEHTSALAGMPGSSASGILGPLHVVLYLLVVTVAPILVLGATLESVIVLWTARREAFGR